MGATMKIQEPTFSEKQRFRQWWLWVLLLIGPGFFLWILVQQVGLGVPFGRNPAPDHLLIPLSLILGFGPALFMFTTGLDTEVNDQGVQIRFRPFHRRWVTFPFDTIEEATALTYNPLRDYGGWGIRYGKKGKAYNVSGNTGVLLVFKDGSSLLIGSKRHTLLLSTIERYFN